MLVITHEDLIPPDTLDGVENKEKELWRTEYDVISTLREMGHDVVPAGVRAELGVIQEALERHKPHVAFNLLEEFDGYPFFDQHVVSYLELKKQKSAQRKKQKQIQVKEMKFRPGTEEGDYQVKLRNLIRFLGDGDKAKVSLRFRGREMVHPEIGMQLMQRIEGDLQEHGNVEAQARFEGRQVTMVLAPKKKKK